MQRSISARRHPWLSHQRASYGSAFWARDQRRTAVWLAILVLVAASATAQAPAEEAEAMAEQAVTAVSFVGLRAFIDPETGELTSTPTPEQIEALSQAIEQQGLANAVGPFSRSSLGLEPFELATGGRGVYLGKRFQSALVVRRVTADELELVCRDKGAVPHAHPEAATAPTEWAER